MPRYCVDYGEYFEFDAQSAGEIVPVMQGRHMFGGIDEDVFLRRIAIEMCEWNGGDYYFHNRDAFARSMIKNGLMEKID